MRQVEAVRAVDEVGSQKRETHQGLELHVWRQRGLTGDPTCCLTDIWLFRFRCGGFCSVGLPSSDGWQRALGASEVESGSQKTLAQVLELSGKSLGWRRDLKIQPIRPPR